MPAIFKTHEQIQELEPVQPWEKDRGQKEFTAKEDIPIVIDYFPDTKLPNRLLTDLVPQKWPNTRLTNVNAEMTEWNCKFPQRRVFQRWLRYVIEQRFGACSNEHNLNFVEMWFARYGKGDYTKVHNHIKALYSFVFFVNAPEGSSPLILTSSKTEIEPVPGKLVLFPGCIYHHVPENNCENRVVLAGNIISVLTDSFEYREQ